jgi:DNA-binding response OmpR family regulator
MVTAIWGRRTAQRQYARTIGGRSMSAQRILVVEDDASILEGLKVALLAEGYAVETAANGKQGWEKAQLPGLSLVVLDLMLPGMSGLEIAKKMRDSGSKTPIIMLTAKGDEDDRVLGLELGADDYLTKPFSVRELQARIRSVLRRSAGEAVDSPDVFCFGNVEVDFRRQRLRKADEAVEISAREFRLLAYLIEHRGTMVTREQLLNDIWGYEVYPTTRTVDNHIARLRKKVEDEPDKPQWIQTVRGAGYLFEVDAT